MKITEVLKEQKNKYYHGSDVKFNRFDVNKLGTDGNDEYGPGIYFVNDKDFAKDYGKYLYTVVFDRLNLVKPNQHTNMDELNKFINLTPTNYVVNFVENYGGDTDNLNESVKEILEDNFYDMNRQEAFLELWGQSLLNFDSNRFYKIMKSLRYDGMIFKRNGNTIVTIYNDSKIKRV